MTRRELREHCFKLLFCADFYPEGETKEQMEELLQQKQKKARGLSGIGVANVKERLQLYYGSAGRVVCESSEEGTKICLCLPAYREQDRYAL